MDSEPKVRTNEEQAFVEEYRGYIKSVVFTVVRKYRLKRLQDIAFELGEEGLLLARQKFDPDHGTKFTTFAYHFVRGAVVDEFRRLGVISRRRQRSVLADAAYSALSAARAEEAPPITVRHKSLNDLAHTFDAMVFDAALVSLAAHVSPDVAKSPESEAADNEMATKVRTQVAELDEPHSTVLTIYFLKCGTLDDIAAHFDCSRSWASRMRKNALKVMKTRFAL